MTTKTPGPIVGLIIGILLIFVISFTSLSIVALRWYRKRDRKNNLDKKVFRKLEMGTQVIFSGSQPKHNRASMFLGVSKDSISITRPKFTRRRSEDSTSSVPSSHHTTSWVINYSPPDCSLREIEEDFQRRYDSTKTTHSDQRRTIRASAWNMIMGGASTPMKYATDEEQPKEKCAHYETDPAMEPQAQRYLDYLFGRNRGLTMSACLSGSQLQTVAIHVPIVTGIATNTRQSITPEQSGTSLASSFSALANQLDSSLEHTLVAHESGCL